MEIEVPLPRRDPKKLRAWQCQDQGQESGSSLGWAAHQPGDLEQIT